MTNYVPRPTLGASHANEHFRYPKNPERTTLGHHFRGSEKLAAQVVYLEELWFSQVCLFPHTFRFPLVACFGKTGQYILELFQVVSYPRPQMYVIYTQLSSHLKYGRSLWSERREPREVPWKVPDLPSHIITLPVFLTVAVFTSSPPALFPEHCSCVSRL